MRETSLALIFSVLLLESRKREHRLLITACRPTLSLVLVLLAVDLLLSASPLAHAASMHYWTGASAVSGNWSTASNWQDNNVPPIDGTATIVFGASKPRLQNTNSFLPSAPNLFVAFNYFKIMGNGYKLYGNPFKAEMLTADYPSGTSSTIYCDLLQGLSIVVVSNNSTLTLSGDMILLTNNVVTIGGLGDCIIKGTISGPGRVVKSPSSYGELRFEGVGANTYSGTTEVNNGLLRLNRYLLVGNISIGTTAVPGDLYIGTGTNSSASDFVVLERHNQIANTSVVRVNGSGQLDLNGFSDTIEGLEIRGGSVTTGDGTLTVEQWLTGNVASGPSIVAGKLAFGDTADEHSVRVYEGGRLEISANMHCPARLRKLGSGELRLAASNHIVGDFRLDEGSLVVAHPAALGSSSAYTILNNLGLSPAPSTLLLENIVVSNKRLRVGPPIAQLGGVGTCGWAGDIQLDGASNFVAEAAASAVLTLSGGIDGPQRTFKKEGAGTVAMSGGQPNRLRYLSVADGRLRLNKTAGLNAIAADIFLPNGSGGLESNILQLDADEQINDTNAVEVWDTGLFSLNSHVETIRSLTGNGAVSLGSGALIISNTSSGTFSGSIRGGREGFSGADVTKAGPGAWILAGSNTYWGKTYLQGGALIVNGSLTHSPVLISPAGTLGGTGVVQSVSFTGAGGKIAPGAPVGTLLAQGNVALSGGALEVELNGPTPGANYDQLACAVAPALGEGATLNVTLGFEPPIGSEFTVLNNLSGAAITGAFAGKPQGAQFLAGGRLFQISYTGGNGNDVVITRMPAPAVSGFVAGVTDGQAQLQAQGLAGLPYVLQATFDLMPPAVWLPIQTNTASDNGLVQFLDPDINTNPQRFYRVVSP